MEAGYVRELVMLGSWLRFGAGNVGKLVVLGSWYWWKLVMFGSL